MTSNFELFVNIGDQKYDMVLPENSFSLISFTIVYPKIQQIVKIGLNEAIDFNTHEFEIFENLSTEGSIIRSMSQFLRHKSVIKIKPKSQQVVSPPIVVNQSPNIAVNVPQSYPRAPQALPIAPTYPSTIPQPLAQTGIQCQQQLTDFTTALPNFIPLSNPTTDPNPKQLIRSKSSQSKAHKSSDMSPNKRKHNFYCKVCPLLLDKPLNRDLLKHKIIVTIETYKRFRHLFKTVAEVCHQKYHSLTVKDWNEGIPNKMIALGYTTFTPEEWRTSFHSHLETYSKVLKVSPNSEVACNLFPYFHIFNSFIYEPKQYFFQKIIELKAKLGLSLPKSQSKCLLAKNAVNNSVKRPVKPTKDFESSVQKLISSEKNIKAFHSMVMRMNIGWNFKDNGDKYWKILADSMCSTEANYRFIVTSDICKTRFYIWTRFYAQTYDKLNAKLEPKVQKIFDLLKIVHVLDLLELFNAPSPTYQMIKEISLRQELREFFNKHLNRIRIQKLQEREIHVNEDNFQTNVPIEKSKNTEIRINIRPKNDTNVRRMCKNPSTNGKQNLNHKSFKKELNFIPLTQMPDPRLKRVIYKAKQFLSKQSVKETTNSLRQIQIKNMKVRPKQIETIVLD